MIRFLTGLLILCGVAGNDCDGKCLSTMDTSTMVALSVIGISLMIWSLPKLVKRYA